MTKLLKVIKYLAIAFGIFWLAAMSIGEVVTDDTKTYCVTSEIRNLNIRISAADLSIKVGETFSVESNLKYLKVEENGNVLTIEERKKFGGGNYNDAVLTVYIPVGTVFESVDLSTGAGRLTVENLSSETLDFELGAGEVLIASLIATKSADIEGGAGRITVSGGALCNLDLEMGVGQLNLSSALTGDCQLDLGVGESNITLIGTKDDYKLEIEKGIGNISVDGKDATDFGSSGNGMNRVEISGGIGSINVRFMDLEA